MERIKSFTVDHLKLLPGVYVSREDSARADLSEVCATCGGQSAYGKDIRCPITTYDIRITRPNFEPVMGTGEIHTIEHIGATWLRNNNEIRDNVIYWGPMGCRTGFYLIMSGTFTLDKIKELMKELFVFIAAFEGDIPGATPVECGNYSDMDLDGAKKRAKKFVEVLTE